MRQQRILAIASGGGHWVQLRRVDPAFAGFDVTYVTTYAGYRAGGDAPVQVVRDANRWRPFDCLILCLQMIRLIARVRPDVVFTTGAAPGCIGIILGKLIGARTIWLDSVANIDRLSLSARIARPFTGLCLTQWPEVAASGAATYAGSVL